MIFCAKLAIDRTRSSAWFPAPVDRQTSSAQSMAGSRIKKLGTVFTRVEGLLKAGAVQHEDRPIWYDVYAAFPPLEEPNFYRQPTTDSVKNIFYPEDAVRA